MNSSAGFPPASVTEKIVSSAAVSVTTGVSVPVPSAPEWAGIIPEPAAQAREAVAAVLQVADVQERAAHGGSRAVTLDFNFGPDRLAVRVELRDGTVQAHFHTESAPLRAALADEWRHAASAPENILRFAEPAFHPTRSPEASAGSSPQGDGGAAREQARERQASAQEFSVPARAGSRPAPHFAGAPEAPRLRPLATTLHLQAVA